MLTRNDFNILAEEISEIRDKTRRFNTACVVVKACKRINSKFKVRKFAEACKLNESNIRKMDFRS